MDKKGGVPVSIKITNQKRIPTIKKILILTIT